ncbi:hypothetical protein ETB91_15200 [Lacticaseibacillus rhamnosus]|nr:hypothetical protein ETB91_15200 [Lacticaseibacillus rhamnosus]
MAIVFIENSATKNGFYGEIIETL